MQPQLSTRTAVARRLGVSVSSVRQLDRVLEPRRTETGVRIYDLARVDFYDGMRAARKDARR